jgi:hypothetical protein
MPNDKKQTGCDLRTYYTFLNFYFILKKQTVTDPSQASDSTIHVLPQRAVAADDSPALYVTEVPHLRALTYLHVFIHVA